MFWLSIPEPAEDVSLQQLISNAYETGFRTGFLLGLALGVLLLVILWIFAEKGQ